MVYVSLLSYAACDRDRSSREAGWGIFRFPLARTIFPEFSEPDAGVSVQQVLSSDRCQLRFNENGGRATDNDSVANLLRWIIHVFRSGIDHVKAGGRIRMFAIQAITRR